MLRGNNLVFKCGINRIQQNQLRNENALTHNVTVSYVKMFRITQNSPETERKDMKKVANMFAINTQWCHHVRHAPLSFSLQNDTLIFWGWLVGCIWKNKSTWYS